MLLYAMSLRPASDTILTRQYLLPRDSPRSLQLHRHKMMKSNSNTSNFDEAGQIRSNIFREGRVNDQEYYEGDPVQGGAACPVTDVDDVSFFIVATATYADLCKSVATSTLPASPTLAADMSKALEAGKKVMLFFTVPDSKHLQGAAVATAASEKKTRPPPHECTISVSWLRSTELPFSVAVANTPTLQIPSRGTGQTYFSLDPSCGFATISSLWNSPPCTFYEPMQVLTSVPSDPLDPAFSPPPGATKWPVFPGPGFIFGGDTCFFGESLAMGILGAPAHMSLAASRIVKGSTLFLYNSGSGLLFGVFEALGPATYNLLPTYGTKNPKSTLSPYPVQVPFRVSFECPPLETGDSVLSQILRARGGAPTVGPTTYAQCAAVVGVMTERCGGGEWMRDLKKGGKGDVPPICVPPS